MKNKVVLITGGSHGYGLGISIKLKEKGYIVWTIARNSKILKEISKKYGIKTITADITNPQDWDKVMETIIKENKQLDLLINNAGAGISIKEINQQTDIDIAQSIAVNLTGHIYGCKRASEIMKKQRSGTIINITSVCAKYAWPQYSVYSAAKAGIVQFGKCLYTELRPFNIKVTTIIPSWGSTNFAVAAGLTNDPEVEKQMMQTREMGDLIENICSLPPHLVIPCLQIQPIIQEIIPM